MEQDNRNGVFSKVVRAGKRRTYFFDVRTTKSNDYFVTITESKRRFDDDGYERHKLHLYKEDFLKFVEALNETVDKVKHDLLPDYDYDQFRHDPDWAEKNITEDSSESATESPSEFNSEAEAEPAESAEPKAEVEDPKPDNMLEDEDLKWD